MDKQAVELVKVQVLADYFHTRHNITSSLWIAGLVGVIILVTTIYYQKNIDFNQLIYFDIIIVIGFSPFLYNNTRIYHRDLDVVNWALGQVEKGETLPSINELRKKKITKEKEESKKEMTNDGNRCLNRDTAWRIFDAHREFAIFWGVLFFSTVVGIIELLPEIEPSRYRGNSWFPIPPLYPISLLYFGLVILLWFSLRNCFRIFCVIAKLTNDPLIHQNELSLGKDYYDFAQKNKTDMDKIFKGDKGDFREWLERLISVIIFGFFIILYLSKVS